MRTLIALPILFGLSLAGCGGDSYIDRLRDSQREGAEFFCPCYVAQGAYATEAECLNQLGMLAEAYVTCIEPVYDGASNADQGFFDCIANEQDAVTSCVLQNTCSDDAATTACYDLYDFARCGTLADSTTETNSRACVELLDGL